MAKRTATTTDTAGTNTIAQHAARTDELLEVLQDDLNKKFGDGTASRLSSTSNLSRIDNWTSTRSLVVDKVLAGGRPFPCSLLPFGRQTEISGMPGVGKTSLCAHLAAEVQSKGGLVIINDTEDRIDHPYWQTLGVNTDRILHLTGHTLEEIFEKQMRTIQVCAQKYSDVNVLMLWDSLGGTSLDVIMDQAESDAKETFMDKIKKAMMVKAKLIGGGLETLNPYISHSKVAYVYTNTLYTVPNVDFGDPYETPGGIRKNFFATVRLRLKRVGQLLEEDESTKQRKTWGHRVQVQAIKNSMAPMLVGLEASVMGNIGFCNDWTVREVAEGMGLITKKKAWSSWITSTGEEISFQGWNGFQEKVVPHADYANLYAQVTERL